MTLNVDVHGHIAVKELLRSGEQMDSWRYELVRNAGEVKLVRPDGRDVVPCRYEPVVIAGVIAHLDRVQVDVMALSVMPFQMYYQLDEQTAQMTSRIANDAIAAAVDVGHGRFVGLGTLPMQNVDLAIRELRRAVEGLGLKGFQFGSNVGGTYLGADRFWPLWEAIQDLNAFIFVHPVQVIGADRLGQYFLANLIGNPIETCRCIADVVFSGLLEEFPRLAICFAHAGGAAPFLWGRWEHGYLQRQEARGRIQKSPKEYVKRLYFDTITHSAAALCFLIDQVGGDHVLVGSDYPFDMGPAEPIRDILSNAGIASIDKRKITGETAAHLLGIGTGNK